MLTDDRTVWLGKFACVNNGALASAAVGRQRENGAAISWYKKDYMRETQMPGVNSRRGHGGMVMSGFGETIVLERRDFGCDAALGPDLVFSASPESRSRFSGAARAAKNPVPAFRQPAAIRLSRGPGKNRKGETLEQITVHFPVVGPKGDCPRAFDYVVRALDRKGQVVKEKRVYSPHINLPPDRDAAEASCVFSVAEVEGAATFTVAPANCWRREGPCLSCARKDV
jgi:hypothetical protein